MQQPQDCQPYVGFATFVRIRVVISVTRDTPPSNNCRFGREPRRCPLVEEIRARWGSGADRRGMNMSRATCAVLLCALAVGLPVRAQQQVQFAVTAVVPTRTVLTVIEEPAALALSDGDLQRGYKDVVARYRVSSNTAQGWLLCLSRRLGIAERIEVRGLSVDVVLEDSGVEVYQPRSSTPIDLELEYRLVLGPAARPGEYALPVHVSATSL
jgi:hypothetical protein